MQYLLLFIKIFYKIFFHAVYSTFVHQNCYLVLSCTSIAKCIYSFYLLYFSILFSTMLFIMQSSIMSFIPSRDATNNAFMSVPVHLWMCTCTKSLLYLSGISESWDLLMFAGIAVKALSPPITCVSSNCSVSSTTLGIFSPSPSPDTYATCSHPRDWRYPPC